MLVKIHKAEDRKIVSIADKDIIGKEFEEGEKYLKISEYFYNGEEMEEEKILELLKSTNSANIVGENAIKFAIDNSIIEEDHILKVEGVPCAIVIFDES
ncbi:MAG: hypothetical protein CMH64_03215 [Nanoarchaeota archaeon]|nr:hypothetical protein [Nanoarchaeota archaeon]|tara:strand:+ start:3336 stop:3632 length:297 start_codon:yes stop_codon:yes gene_type:complete